MNKPKMREVPIDFTTTQFAPNFSISLLCEDSLHGSPVYGEYYGDAWHFKLLLHPDKQSTQVAFQLNREVNNFEGPIFVDVMQLNWGDRHVFSDQNISFHHYTPRYIHHIDRLVTEDSDFQRRFIKSNLDESREYDVIVIGSGMGGGIVADALSDKGLDVLVLEGGSVHQPQSILNVPVPNTFATRHCVSFLNEPGSVLDKDICMNFGGRSIYWSAIIPRMNDWEIQFWPVEVRDYLLSVEGYWRAEILFRKRTEYSEFEKELKRKVQSAIVDYSVDHTPRSLHTFQSQLPLRKGSLDEIPTGTFSTAALLLNSMSHPGLAGSDHLTINLNQLVTHIEVAGRRALKVFCQDLLHNRQRAYQGKYIILGAGATESPCIAIRSNILDKSGKMGIGLTDHQNAELLFEIPRSSPLFSSNDHAKLLLYPKLNSKGRNKYSCELALNWKFWDVRYEDDDFWDAKFPDDQPIKSTIKFTFGNRLNDKNWIKPTTSGKSRVYVEPMKERPLEEDVNQLKNEVLSFFGVKDKSLFTTGLKYRERAETYHSGGSLRMGDYGKAVVDSHLRFHEYDNLYCCDLSVFPDIPLANPSLTLGALALRLAEDIKQKI
jgi:hypothetical protein